MITSVKIDFRRKRDFSEKINASFEFLKQNFRPLGRALLYIAGPVCLLAGISLGIYQATALRFRGGDSALFSEIFSDLGSFLLFAMIASVTVMSVVYSYIVLYMDGDDQEITVAQVWGNVKTSLPWLFLAIIIVSIVIMLGFVLLILPGIYLSVVLMLVFVIMVREKLTIFDAMGRAFHLISGKWWSTFGLLMVMSLLQMIMALAFSIPMYVITFMVTFNSAYQQEMAEPGSVMYLLAVATNTVYGLATFLLQAMVYTGLAFQYFNLVERKESVGLMQKIETLGSTPAYRQNEETD